MSTFNGIVREFPNIRIDFFRRHPDLKPPTACFLSHIHSDHLQGLESPVLPFVYCSAATKRLLLRMEKYPHRINFAKGILEAGKQTYRHLKKVLKALPLQTPTMIELNPKTTIRVTLFDANHCPGSVMFLIESDGKAILYTGDIRSETWWINSLIRQPSMIPFTLGNRRIDCIYMDTTFAAREDVYRDFPSKASGLAELINKVDQYPPETIFYFRSWTLGYEDAWLALSSTLGSRIHVDAYQIRLYRGLLEDHGERISVQEAASLIGFAAGNHIQEGCLTDDPTISVRIHSCEPGTACHASLLKKPNLVWITPIVSRTADGTEVYEIGAGGGGGDLYQTPELDIADPEALLALQALCADSLRDANMLEKALAALQKMSSAGNSRASLEGLDIDLDSDADVTLKDFIKLISHSRKLSQKEQRLTIPDTKLTTAVHFPYSRHSSYNELRELVSAFKPKDICPCTVDLDTWTEDVSMETLFGDLCSEKIFVYDAENRVVAKERKDYLAATRKRKREMNDDGETQRSTQGSNQISDDTFETAEEIADHTKRTREATNIRAADASTTTGTTPPDNGDKPSGELDTPDRRLKAIEKAFHALRDDDHNSVPSTASQPSMPLQNHAPEIVSRIEEVDLTIEDVRTTQMLTKEDEETADTQTSQISLPLSAFESQPQIGGSSSPRPGRLKARIEAYTAAKSCLNGEGGAWSDLGIRSIGYSGHISDEVEL
jgi:DNA cross-link repair 1C protein